MFFRRNPRGALPPPIIQPVSFTQQRFSITPIEPKRSSKRLSSLSLSPKSQYRPCNDWIFSSATDVHVALDKSAFKEYVAFDSYVLALSNDRPIHVAGIGSVELKIRRRANSKESHVVVLTNVLHVPTWLCNIFSDTYFDSGHGFEHTWTNSGVQFSKYEETGLRAWGYTEGFCSLERLVLAKSSKDSRSPMLEDRDREVFSINLRWPLSQRDRWNKFLEQGTQQPLRASMQAGLQRDITPAQEALGAIENNARSNVITRRATLSSLNANIVRRSTGKRVSSLKTTVSERNLTG